MHPTDRGSATVETTVAIVLLLILVMGAIEVSLALYARNVVMAAAHQGARAAVELGRDPQHAARVARKTVRDAAGGLVKDLDVRVGAAEPSRVRTFTVAVSGSLRVPGPVGIPIPVAVTARSSRPLP